MATPITAFKAAVSTPRATTPPDIRKLDGLICGNCSAKPDDIGRRGAK